MKSRAWILKGPDQLELEEYEVLPPAKDQVLVRNRVTSVCATDPKIVHGHWPFSVFPFVPGHEISGDVVEVGSEAAGWYGFKPGDRITLEPLIPCGRCKWCRTEFNYHKCRPMRAYGVSLPASDPPYLFGGYSDYLYLAPGTLAYKLGDRTPHLAGSLSSVIGNGVRWVKNLGQLGFGKTLAISGVGSQGLAALMAARECGVKPIAVLGLAGDKARFELAKEYGADFTVNIEEVDPVEAVPDLLGGPPDVVIETSGVPAAIQTALDLVKPTGRVASIGLSGGKTTPIVFDTLVAKGVTIAVDHGQTGNYPDAMRILNSGDYAIEKINNVHYSLEELPRALAETANPPEGFIKGAIVFDD